MNCNVCGKPGVAYKSYCPACGSPVIHRPRPRLLWFWYILGALLVVGLAIAWLFLPPPGTLSPAQRAFLSEIDNTLVSVDNKIVACLATRAQLQDEINREQKKPYFSQQTLHVIQDKIDATFQEEQLLTKQRNDLLLQKQRVLTTPK